MYPAFPPILLLLLSFADVSPDFPRLREQLFDSQRSREQSQAALLLLRDKSPKAQEIVRAGIGQTEAPDVFLALAAAVRMSRDTRFGKELLEVLESPLTGPRLALRQAAAEALTATADPALVDHLAKRLRDRKPDLGLKQTYLWLLGRSNLQEAAPVLIAHLDSDQPALRHAALDGLIELSGLFQTLDRDQWTIWWEHVRPLSREEWLQQRLSYQASRTRRLETELERSRTQMVRLHQQLYLRLPAGERVGHVQTLSEADDPTVRQLAVVFAADLLTGLGPWAREGTTVQVLTEVLQRLSHDSHPEVQRLSVLALGRLSDEVSFERLKRLLTQGKSLVRAAAARALAQQARTPDETGRQRRKEVVPLLQKALEDKSLEVVVEAAEDLGALGVAEAGPVLVGLLKHSTENVRVAASHALERVADQGVLDNLVEVVGDPSVAVRFGLVGAIGRAVGDGQALTDAQREKVLTKLQALLLKDADPGVRSRAATVLGECGPSSVLPALWQRVAAGEDSRVQEKAWGAIIEVVARSGDAEVLREWESTLAKAGQLGWRSRLLGEVHLRWQARSDARSRFLVTAPLLAAAKLDEGKWQAALPLYRELLARGEDAALREQALRGLLRVGEQALRAGEASQVRRLIQDVRPYLPAKGKLSEEFDQLERRAS